jgi:hypothetical protein
VFEINPATGRVNISPSEVREAERGLRAHCAVLVKLIQVDEVKAANPADIALCARVREAAFGNYPEFENLLTFPEVNALFNRGALHFRQPAPPPAPKKKARR